MAQEGMVEADHVAHAEVVGGRDADGLGAAHHLHRTQDLQVVARGRQRLQPDLVDEDHEGRRAAVQDGHLRPVHLHEHVVDAQALQRREEVLHGAHRDAVPAERRGVVEPGQVLDRGGDLHADVGSEETDAVAGGGRLQLQAHGLAGVEADSRATLRTAQRSSIGHENSAGRGCKPCTRPRHL
jgi:hypothetical protein